jgi:hypothetical protein
MARIVASNCVKNAVHADSLPARRASSEGMSEASRLFTQRSFTLPIDIWMFTWTKAILAMSTKKQYHDRAFLGKKEVVSNDFKNRHANPVGLG